MRDGDVQERRHHSLIVTRHPLVTAAWLAEHASDASVVIVDVRWYLQGKRGIDAFTAGHVPRARFLDIDRDLSSAAGPGRPGRHPLPSADAFADVLARLGVRAESHVVAYDDAGGAQAARVWWLLRYFGHDIGSVLDGGIQAWTRAGFALESGEAPPSSHAPRLVLSPRGDMVVGKAEVAELSRGARGLLLDARAPERFEGKVEPIDARAGHIPGATNAPFVQNLVEPGGVFRSRQELATHYDALGATNAKPLVAYCGSGVTACHDLLALSIAGRDDALLYEGSWSEWAGDPARPAATGKG